MEKSRPEVQRADSPSISPRAAGMNQEALEAATGSKYGRPRAAGMNLTHGIALVAHGRRPHEWAIGRTFTFTITLPEPSNAGGRPPSRSKPAGKTPRKSSPKAQLTKQRLEPADTAGVDTKRGNPLKQEQKERAKKNGVRPKSSGSAGTVRNPRYRSKADVSSVPRSTG